MRNHRRSNSSSIRSSPSHGMDLKTNAGEGGKGSGAGGTASAGSGGGQPGEHHRFSPGPDLGMLQKSYVHRDSVPEEMMGFNQGGYDMTPANSLEQNCNSDTNAASNRIHPFAPFASTPPGSGGTNNGSPFCSQSQAAAAAAVAAGLTQQSQLHGSGGGGPPPSFMDTPPPSSFCSAPYNYSLYSMHSQDSRVKLEKEKEAYNNKHAAEDKEMAASKWITS